MKKIILSVFCIYGAFIADAQTPDLKWAKQFGGAGEDIGNSIGFDGTGNVYSSGVYKGPADFDPGSGTFNLTGSGVYVSKLDATGKFLWAKQFVGNSRTSIAVESNGNVYITGYYTGTADFDPGAAVFNLVAPASGDGIFIVKLNATGDFVWAKGIEGAGTKYGSLIALDPTGNVYLTGSFLKGDFNPGAGVFNLTAPGLYNGRDVFVLKLDNAGNFVWAKNMGGEYDDEANSIAVDASGNVYTTGKFEVTADFDPGSGTFNLTGGGAFISKLNSSGSFAWAVSIGGSDDDIGFAIALDATGNVYTTGSYDYTEDFDPGAGTFEMTAVDVDDIFILKLNNSGNFVWAKSIGSVSWDEGHSISVNSSGVYTTGIYSGTADFDPGSGVFNLGSQSGRNIFISKLTTAGNFVWAWGIGNNSDESGTCIRADASDNVYTTGYFVGTVGFSPKGTLDLTSASNMEYDAFVLKTNSIGSSMIHNSNLKNFQIYPNPGNAQLFFSTGVDGTFSIMNELGQTVLEFKSDANSNQAIDISGLPNGVYYINGSIHNEVFTEKFVVVK